MVVKNRRNKYIVFCEEHYNPLGAIRSLGEAGIKPIVIIIRSRLRIASCSKYISKLHIVDSIEEGYKLLLSKYSNKGNKAFIITCDDKITSYLDSHYEQLIKYFYFFNAGKPGLVTYYMDKNNINLIAEKHGFNVAKTHVVKLGDIPDGLYYPIITKSISSNSGGWKNDVFICQSEAELKEAYKKIKSSTVLLQKYIDKENELCIDGFSINQGRESFLSIQAKYDYILDGKYSFLMTVKNIEDKELFTKIQELIADMGYEGIFCIEFLVGKDGRLYFLEVNLRNSGWSYASTCAGMNLPFLWTKSTINQEIEYDQCFAMIPDGFKAMVEISDFKSRVLAGKISLGKWLKQLKNCRCLFYYSREDKKPFISAIVSKLIG